MPLESLLGPTVTAWIAHVVAALTAFALLYGGAKILWTRLTGRTFPVNRFTRGLDALAELGTNVLGFVNKLTRGNGQPLLSNPDVQRRDALIAEMSTALDDLRRRLGDAPLSTADLAAKAGAVAVSETRGGFDPTAHITRAQMPPIDSNRGFATLRALLAVVVLGIVGGSLVTGCPNWNRPACTTPGAYSCVADQPRWCSTTHELTPVGDEPCGRSGRVCVVEPDGMATCAPPAATVDGGAP